MMQPVKAGQPAPRWVRPGVALYRDATFLSNDAGGDAVNGGSYVYDIQWNAAGTEIYGSRSAPGFGYYAYQQSSGYYKYTLTGNAFTGLQIYPGSGSSDAFGNIAIDPGTNYLYTQFSEVLNASTGLVIAQLGGHGILTPSPSRSRLYQPTSVGTLLTYDLATRSPLLSYTTAISGFPSRLVTWGTDGVAFVALSQVTAAPTGPLYLLSGKGVTTP